MQECAWMQNVSTERLKWRTMRKSTLCQILYVRITNDTHNNQSSGWPKWGFVLRRWVIILILLDKMSFQMVRQTGFRYVNYQGMKGKGPLHADTFRDVIWVQTVIWRTSSWTLRAWLHLAHAEEWLKMTGARVIFNVSIMVVLATCERSTSMPSRFISRITSWQL